MTYMINNVTNTGSVPQPDNGGNDNDSPLKNNAIRAVVAAALAAVAVAFVSVATYLIGLPFIFAVSVAPVVGAVVGVVAYFCLAPKANDPEPSPAPDSSYSGNYTHRPT